jgi:ABC-type antimicrobial peptide transport system permease subunit
MNSKLFQQSFKSLASNPLRTFLTTLGLMIGICTVVVILSAGAGFKNLLTSEIQSYGNNTLFIKTRVPPTTKNRAQTLTPGIAVGITTFTENDLTDVRTLPNVENTYGMVTGLSVASYRNQEKSVLYYGVDSSMFQVDQHTLSEGRFFTDAENTGAAQVVILGSNLAKNLFLQDDPLGQLVRVGNLNFQVIGVYNPQGALSGADDSLYMPMETAQSKMLGLSYISAGVVELQNPNLADQTAAAITLLLRHDHRITDPAKDDFQVVTEASVLDIYNTIFNGITILLILIAAISLAVGGVGIMNIMYVSIAERTSEIGLKKALGAKNSDILWEFLIESVLITILGGVIGIVVGYFLSWVVAIIAGFAGLAWTFVVPLYAIVISLGVSGTIGIFFGVFPARSAAKLDPIEALQYE